VALKRILGFVLALGLVGCAHGQFLGYVSLQTTQQTLATNVACTGSAQTFPVQNLGQTQHYATISSSGVQSLSLQIQGVDAKGNVFAVSDTAANPSSTSAVSGSGYYPIVQVQVSCLPSGGGGTFTLSYSGAGGPSGPTVGDYLKSQLDKIIFNNVAGNANKTAQVTTPFGSSSGVMTFQYNGASAGGGTITVGCAGAAGVFSTIFSAALPNDSNQHFFPVGNFNCLTLQASYGNSGAAGTVIVEFQFSQPGAFSVAYTATHITGTTATVVKGTPGLLHTVSINTGAAGTVSVFDLASASCTGTPATNTVAVITATTTTLQTFSYDTNLLNGICVKASVGMDLTISSQ